VASLGTALTEQQARLLRRYTDHVIIAYDADAAGQAATLRSLDILAQRDMKVSVLTVPDEKDPDDYIRRHGPERFHALIDKSLPLLDYKLSVARKESQQHGKLDVVAYQEASCTILAHESNAIVRELYASRLAEEIHASAESVMEEIEKRLNQQEASSAIHPQYAKATERNRNLREKDDEKQSASKQELYLLGLAATDPGWVRESGMTPEDFSPGPLRELAERVLERIDDESMDPAVLIELCEDKRVRDYPLHDLMTRVCMRLEDLFGHQNLKQAAAEQLWRQRQYRLRCQLDELKKKGETDLNSEDKSALKEDLRRVTERLVQLKQKPDWDPEQSVH
jgi:DNA primase